MSDKTFTAPAGQRSGLLTTGDLVTAGKPLPTEAGAVFTSDRERYHRERLQWLQQRYDRAIGDDGQAHIQSLMDAENVRWQLILDSQPSTHQSNQI